MLSHLPSLAQPTSDLLYGVMQSHSSVWTVVLSSKITIFTSWGRTLPPRLSLCIRFCLYHHLYPEHVSQAMALDGVFVFIRGFRTFGTSLLP